MSRPFRTKGAENIQNNCIQVRDIKTKKRVNLPINTNTLSFLYYARITTIKNRGQ